MERIIRHLLPRVEHGGPRVLIHVRDHRPLVLQGAGHAARELSAHALRVVPYLLLAAHRYVDQIVLLVLLPVVRTTVQHLVLIPALVLQRYRVLGPRTRPALRRRAPLRNWHASGYLVVVVDGAGVAFAALALGDSVVLLSHHARRPIHYADRA